MEVLPVHTLIHNQYQILDHSGRVPFSVVFGLCRRSSQGSDPRSLIFNTSKSALDVPYALRHGLLKLNVEDADLKSETALAVQQLDEFEETGTTLRLSSPINRQGNWKTDLTVHRYEIDPGSQLAAIFKPGKNYELSFTSEDLGIKTCHFDEPDSCLTAASDGRLEAIIASRPQHGRCRFTVVPSIPIPPKLHTALSLSSSSPSRLRISVTNPSPTPISVQTSGIQKFLCPWGPMQPEPEHEPDSRTRVLDPSAGESPMVAYQNLKVFGVGTGEVVHEPSPRGPSRPGPERDPRPFLEKMVTLEAGGTITRDLDIGKVLERLQDGEYEVELVGKGMWWCEGRREDFEKEVGEDGDGRVPRRVWERWVVPAMLESEEKVGIRVEGGRLSGS